MSEWSRTGASEPAQYAAEKCADCPAKKSAGSSRCPACRARKKAAK